jgi:tRNA threonylcarbamoyladenosine biosynthesis protein TsaE
MNDMAELNPKPLRLLTSSEEDALALGRALGKSLVPGAAALLSGDLGTGKTTLVRGIGDALGATRVRSPSFTLVNEYRTEAFTIVHADLYRLDPGEMEDLGLEDYLTSTDKDHPSVLLVEWPERWTTRPNTGVLTISIEARGENERIVEISVSDVRGNAALVLKNLREAIFNGKIDTGVGLQPALD